VLDNKGEADIYTIGPTKLVLKKKVGSFYVTQWEETVEGVGFNPGNFYHPSSEAVDQGAADATYNTVKDIIDGLAADEEATIFFPHNSGGVTTAYTFLTAETVPSNVTLEFETGAMIVTASGINVDIAGTMDSNPSQKFDLSQGGTVSGLTNVPIIYPEYFGAVGDGVTEDTTAIQNTINSCVEKSVIQFVPGKTYLTGTLTLRQQSYLGAGNLAGFTTRSAIQYSGTTGNVMEMGTGPGFYLHGLVIDGNATTGSVISMACYRATISGNEIRNADTLISITEAPAWNGENKIMQNFLYFCHNGVDIENEISADNAIWENYIWSGVGNPEWEGLGETAIHSAAAGTSVYRNHIYQSWDFFMDFERNGARVINNFFNGLRTGNTGLRLTVHDTVNISTVIGNRMNQKVDASGSTGIVIVGDAPGKCFVTANNIDFYSTVTGGNIGITQIGPEAVSGDAFMNLVTGADDAYDISSSAFNTLYVDALKTKTNSSSMYFREVNQEELKLQFGFGHPESAVTADVGSMYLPYSASGVTRVNPFIKVSGTGTDTGWRRMPALYGEVATGADATGTNVYSGNANTLPANDGFLRIPTSDGDLVHIPYWESVTP